MKVKNPAGGNRAAKMSRPCSFCKTAVRQTECSSRFVCMIHSKPQTFMRSGAARCKGVYYEDDTQIAGLECYYSSPDATESKVYAESIIDAVSLSDDIKVREAKSESYYVLRNTKMPAVLVELGFLSNYSECQKLLNDDYQETLSQKIAEGILHELVNSREVAAD